MLKRLSVLAAAAVMGLTFQQAANAQAIDLAGLGLEADAMPFYTDMTTTSFSSGFGDLSINTNPPFSARNVLIVGFGPDLADPLGYALLGDLTGFSEAVGSGPGAVEFLFASVLGADSFGTTTDRVLARFVADDPMLLGPNPLGIDAGSPASLVPFALATGALSLTRVAEIAPIPLPAGLPLVATGVAIFGFAAARRRRGQA